MRKPWSVIVAVYLTLFDLIFTLQYWHIEDNPIVLALGPVPFTILKLVSVVLFVIFWLSLRGTYLEDMGELVIIIYAYLMAAVAILNITHVLDIPFW